ncbi:MAG: hypothetical protein LBH51_10215 [Treponema sp.]|jgi:hypothetical protein|nr:hypothetical protein [Treponema sp.]
MPKNPYMKGLSILTMRFCLLFLCGAAVFSLPKQKILYPGDPLYDSLAILAMEQGIVFLAGSTLTVMQAEQLLDRVEPDSLSPPGLVRYNRVRAGLAEDGAFSLSSSILRFDLDPGLQPELYFKSNQDLSWVYGRNQRLPFFPFSTAFSLSSYLTLESDLYFGENRRLSDAHDNYFNFMYDKMIDRVQNIDTNLPKRAYISAGYPFRNGMGINFRLGIGDDFIGRTRTGSIILSDNMKEPSYGNLTIYTPYLKYTADVMQLEVTKYFYLHRININVFDRLSFSMVEGVMVNAPFEIRFLNPLMIFHGLTAWETYRMKGGYNDQFGGTGDRVGSFLGLIFDGRIWKYGRLYGMAAMNQLELPGVERGPESTTPDGFAFQGGYESFLPLESGYLNFGLEGVYTFPYMYVLESVHWSFVRESKEVSNPELIREWTGTPFGPDSIAGTVWAGYQSSAPWSLYLSFLMVVQGEKSGTNIFDSPPYFPVTHEDILVTTPTGTPTYTYVVSAEGKWSPRDWLRLSLRPAFKIVAGPARYVNYTYTAERGSGFEVSLSAQIMPRIYPQGKR